MDDQEVFLVTDVEIEESRQRLGIPPDWIWAPCAAKCGDLVWHSGDEQDAAEAKGVVFLAVCSPTCAMTLAQSIRVED